MYILRKEYFLAFCYHTDLNATQSNSNAENTFSLWHHRLGNPSHNVLKSIQQGFSITCDHVNSICDSCHYAKKTKLSFPLSNTQTAYYFEQIHVDI